MLSRAFFWTAKTKQPEVLRSTAADQSSRAATRQHAQRAPCLSKSSHGFRTAFTTACHATENGANVAEVADASPATAAVEHSGSDAQHDVEAQQDNSAQHAAAEPMVVKQLALQMYCSNIPHPEKAHYQGEDAWFISGVGGGAFGIADGVGGWKQDGINPGDYSKSLMRNAQQHLESLTAEARGLADVAALAAADAAATTDAPAVVVAPKEALAKAHARTRLPGSSTACIVQLDAAQSRIAAVNLGDSGFLVVRDGSIVFETQPMEHFFDCPFQMGACPEYVEDTDSAEDAERIAFNVQPGDHIVAATDGFWDNVYKEELLQVISMCQQISSDDEDEVTRAAQALTRLAEEHAADMNFESPYTKEALAHGLDIPWWEKLMTSRIKDGKLCIGRLQGGKMDDITVLIAKVIERERIVQPPSPPAADAAAHNGTSDGSSSSDESAAQSSSADTSSSTSEATVMAMASAAN